MRRLRPNALGSPSHSFRPTARARSQGQRRIHGPGLPSPSPRSARLRRRSLMVGRGRHRPVAHRTRAMAAVKIVVPIGSGLVRALVRCHRASSGEGRPAVIGRRRQGPDRVTLASSVGSGFSTGAPWASIFSRAGNLEIAPYRSKIQKASLERWASYRLRFEAAEHHESPPPFP